METLIVWSPATPHPALEEQLGRDAARHLDDAFLDDTVALALKWRETHIAADLNRQVVVVGPPHQRDQLVARLAPFAVRLELAAAAQEGAVNAVVANEFGRGARAVAVIGVTTPSLPPYMLDEAFRALQFHRVVAGPSFDDGTWLIGAQRVAPGVIETLVPGRPHALLQAESMLQTVDVAVSLLPFWFTVDGDLARLRWHLRQRSMSGHEATARHTRAALARHPPTPPSRR
jgi:glycosyltransferase A (GT-A) superfamily protein (DUF2064 family)